ncbi:unnamed protein product [Prorocentrum cordatum]|uniref:PH domain-containing protein n=1 Tax=Prorocentrum cordatum TaxID=2364126 RepID=A0ABN9RH00_9DINO|nr:unnamed protein product [Polarella glacialis]
MSWYVDQRGRRVWVEREETVFTIDEPTEEPPTENLTYLASASSKAVYAEHSIDEESGARGKKKDAQAGRQRGFVVRMDHDDDGLSRVAEDFVPVARDLLKSGAVSRVDVDTSRDGAKKKKKKAKDRKPGEEEEDEKEREPALPLGVNECRVETTARCQHFAHGTGWRVDVSSGEGAQRIFLFTAKKELTSADWHKQLLASMGTSGKRVMLGRMLGEGPDGSGAGKTGPAKKDEAQHDEDDWLKSMMGLSKDRSSRAGAEPAGGGGGAEGAAGDEGPDGGTAPAPKAPAKKAIAPPWLRR